MGMSPGTIGGEGNICLEYRQLMLLIWTYCVLRQIVLLDVMNLKYNTFVNSIFHGVFIKPLAKGFFYGNINVKYL